MLASILTIAGAVILGVSLFRAGYKKGYNDGAVDGYSVKR